MMGGERDDGILVSTVGVGNSPLGKIASPRDGSAAVAIDWSTASSSSCCCAVTVAVDRSTASCGVAAVAVDRSTAASCWSTSAADVGVAADWSADSLCGSTSAADGSSCVKWEIAVVAVAAVAVDWPTVEWSVAPLTPGADGSAVAVAASATADVAIDWLVAASCGWVTCGNGNGNGAVKWLLLLLQLV